MDGSSESTTERTQKISRLSALRRDSPGSDLESELWALGLSARTFAVNAIQLHGAVTAFENALPNPLFVPGKRAQLWDYSFEIVRFFQNAVAAGESFLEHCRSSVRRRYRGQPAGADFEQHYATSIEGSPVRMFVKELRGHLLHRESIRPVVSRRLVDFSDPYDALCAIELNTDPIRQQRDRWKRENPKAVEYLDRLGSTINIRRLLDEYRAVVEPFGDWVLARERRLNTAALQESKRLDDELIALLDPLAAEEVRVFRGRVERLSWFE